MLIIDILLIFKREKNVSYFVLMDIVFALICLIETICFFKCFTAIKEIGFENFLIVTIGSFIIKSIIYEIYTGCEICTSICKGMTNKYDKMQKDNNKEEINLENKEIEQEKEGEDKNE